jgi:hypothetical protein
MRVCGGEEAYFQIWQYLEMSGQMRIFAALPTVATELEAGRTAESVLTLIGDKNIFLFPGIDRHDCTEIYHLAIKGSQN